MNGALPLIARVVPDLPAVERVFDYLVPDAVRDQVRVGTIVRVELHGRRVRGWVVELADEPAEGVDPARLKPLTKVSSQGPPPEVVDLAGWAAWRWGGRWVHLLRTASSPVSVATPAPTAPPVAPVAPTAAVEVVRIPPAADRWPAIVEAVTTGPAIVVVPAVDTAARLVARLRREGHRVARLAGDVTGAEFGLAASGTASVVGTRIAVWAPIPDAHLTSILVVDEHDEALQAEQAPTWHARDVAVERARRAGVPCRLLSPVPTLHALAAGPLTVVGGERGGWPKADIVDRRDEDPRMGLLSPRLAGALRGGGRVVCVLNRLGRSRLLACTACGQVAECDRCGAAVTQSEPGVLRCLRGDPDRPPVCLSCGGGRFKNLRAGVARVREELEALAGEPVAEVTATQGDPGEARISVGTEAVLHRLGAASVAVVAFLDLDQELLAPRYRAAEQAMALLARGARAVGDRRTGGRLLLQTRLPEHPVVRAVQLGDPGRLIEGEAARRRDLRFPPAAAIALVSGAGAGEWVSAAPDVLGVEVLDGGEGAWLVRAAGWEDLADYLAVVPRPAARTRIEVDPPRL
jgi:primosomal protein N' (replication factor Y) (superfamily II helicase)